MSNTETPYETQCDILSDLWIEYKNDKEFEDFIQYNDLGLPLAYAISNGIVSSTDLAKSFITETFSVLLGGFDIEDTGFDSLEDIIVATQAPGSQ